MILHDNHSKAYLSESFAHAIFDNVFYFENNRKSFFQCYTDTLEVFFLSYSFESPAGPSFDF